MTTPAYRIEVDGVDVSSKWKPVLLSMEITDEAGLKADTLEATFSMNPPIAKPKPGAKIKAWLGYEPAPAYRGEFVVDEWELSGPPNQLTVKAKAAAMTSKIKSAHSKAYDGKTLGAIVNEVASTNGLTAQVDSELAAIQIKHIDQQNESDLNFLSRLAKRNGGTFKLGDGKVILAKKGSEKLPGGQAKTAIVLTPIMATRWSFTQGKRGEYKTVSATYMDHAGGRRKTVKAGSGEPKHHIRLLYGSAAEAKAAAQAELGNYARGQGTFEFEGPGLPSVFAEAKVTAEGFDPDADGEFSIKSVHHRLEDGGYTTSISLERGGTGTGQS